jgi:hypothetical protein
MPKKHKHYAVIGRIIHDDEDSCYIIRTTGEQAARNAFKRIILADAGVTEAKLRERHGLHKDDTAVFINHIIMSRAPLQHLWSA